MTKFSYMRNMCTNLFRNVSRMATLNLMSSLYCSSSLRIFFFVVGITVSASTSSMLTPAVRKYGFFYTLLYKDTATRIST